MTRATFITAVSLAALAVSAGVALARDRPGFDQIDIDSNGALSREELSQMAQTRFQRVDTNGDGLASKDELLTAARARNERRVDRVLERLDSNSDGSLSIEELTARRDPARMFDRMDVNADGAISRAEFDAARKDRRAKRHDAQTKSD